MSRRGRSSPGRLVSESEQTAPEGGLFTLTVLTEGIRTPDIRDHNATL